MKADTRLGRNFSGAESLSAAGRRKGKLSWKGYRIHENKYWVTTSLAVQLECMCKEWIICPVSFQIERFCLELFCRLLGHKRAFVSLSGHLPLILHIYLLYHRRRKQGPIEIMGAPQARKSTGVADGYVNLTWQHSPYSMGQRGP